MYINDNPVLKGFTPSNGNHSVRSKLLHQPNSFVPAHLAHDVNAFESHMPIPYDHGGNNNNNNGNNYGNNNYNGNDRQQNGNTNNYGPYHGTLNNGGCSLQDDRPYDFFGNGNFGDGNNDKTFGNTNESRFVNYGGEYGRHRRTYNHTSDARFDPTRNSHNYIDYGIHSRNYVW